jgi:hypothetical protein
LTGLPCSEVLRLLQVDQLRAAGEVRVIEHLIDADFHRRRLGHEAVNVGECQLHGLDLQVLRVDAVHGQARHIEMAQDAQRDQRGDALPVGRDLVQRVAAVVLRDGLDPLGLVRGEVAGHEVAAMRCRKTLDRLRDLAAVIGLAPRLCDGAQAPRRSLELEQLADLGRTAPGHEGLGEARQGLQFGRSRRPFLLHHHRQQVAPLGDLDGRLHQVSERQLAEALAHRHPAAHRTGHGDGIEAAFGGRCHVLPVLAAEILRRPGRRCAARGVQPVQFLAVPEDAERVAAQPVAHRLADRHGRRGRHGGIHRVAAVVEHAQAGLRRQRVGRRHDVARKDRQARAEVGI